MCKVNLKVSDSGSIHGGNGLWEENVHGKQKHVIGLGNTLLTIDDADQKTGRVTVSFRMLFKFYSEEAEAGQLPVFLDDDERVYFKPEDLKVTPLPTKDMIVTNSDTLQRCVHGFYGGEPQPYLIFRTKSLDPDHILSAEVKWQGSIKHSFDLRYFPHDLQSVVIRAKFYDSDPQSKFLWLALPPKTVPMPDFNDFSLSDYKVVNVATNFSKVDSTSLKSDEGLIMEYSFGLQRKPEYYVLACTVPFTMITCIATAAFHIDESDIGSRLGYVATLLLATIATKFVVSPDLPKLPYCTSFDVDLIVTMLFLFSIIQSFTWFKGFTDTEGAIHEVSRWMALIVNIIFWKRTIMNNLCQLVTRTTCSTS